jgi:tetratricopeptide (TPR) repeat protein
MTPEAMKPEEACTQAAIFEQEGKLEEAMEIYKKVLVVHPDHPIARGKIS